MGRTPPLNTFSHFGRFVAIEAQVKANGWPDVYPAVSNPADPTQGTLQSDFASLITSLNTLWNTGSGDIFVMDDLLDDSWRHAGTPQAIPE